MVILILNNFGEGNTDIFCNNIKQNIHRLSCFFKIKFPGYLILNLVLPGNLNFHSAESERLFHLEPDKLILILKKLTNLN